MDSKELVEMFGTNSQTSLYKRTNKLPTNVRNSILKTVRTMYEDVRIEKEGRKNYYIIENELEEPTEREDGRIAGNARTIEYTKNMDIIVVSALETGDVTSEPQTLRKWLLDFGLINDDLFKLLGGKYDGTAKYRNEKMMEYSDIFEEDKLENKTEFIDDFVSYTNNLRGQMERTLMRMKRSGIIEFFESYRARLYNEDPSVNETVYVTPKMFITMNQEKLRLLKIYRCTNWDVANLANKASVKAFVSAWDNYLKEGVKDEHGNHVPIDFYYKVFSIDLRAGRTKSATMNYLMKFNMEALEAYQEMTNGEFFKKNIDDYILNREKEVAMEARKRIEKNKFTRKLAKKAFQGEENWAFMYVKRIHELQKCYGDVFKYKMRPDLKPENQKKYANRT